MIEGEEMKKTVKGLTDFIKKSPTAFHAVEELRVRLLEEGFTELNENEKWKLSKGGKYFVTRNGSSIISFKVVAFSGIKKRSINKLLLSASTRLLILL